MCCIFLWKTSGAKHNLSSSLSKLSRRGMLNVHKHVLCFCKGTSQIPADASSAGKYLAPALSPRIYPPVGSGKTFHFQLFRYIESVHKWSILSCRARTITLFTSLVLLGMARPRGLNLSLLYFSPSNLSGICWQEGISGGVGVSAFQGQALIATEQVWDYDWTQPHLDSIRNLESQGVL